MKLLRLVATLGPIGYLKGSGTFASLVTVATLWYFRFFFDQFYGYVFFGTCVLSFCAVSAGISYFKERHDPSEIVIDEVVGCLITFCGVSLTASNLIVGFLLFRFFDIVKPLGIRSCEKFKGPWGILLDDILAGIYSSLVLHALGFVCTHYHS